MTLDPPRRALMENMEIFELLVLLSIMIKTLLLASHIYESTITLKLPRKSTEQNPSYPTHYWLVGGARE